jgi:hypothetical protein
MPFINSLEFKFGFVGNSEMLINPTNLQIWLDASSNTSYPGSGTVWSNLVTTNSAFNYNFEGGTPVVSTISFNNTLNTTLHFNGTSNYAMNSNSLLSAALSNNWAETREYWIYWRGAPSALTSEYGTYTPDSAWYDAQASMSNTSLVFSLWQGSLSTFFVTNSFDSNAWNHIVWQYNLNTSNFATWVNGVRQFNYTNVVRQVPNTALYLSLGRGSATNYGWGSAANNFLDGNFGVYRWYNTFLTSNQILQNFNAERGRFGR